MLSLVVQLTKTAENYYLRKSRPRTSTLVFGKEMNNNHQVSKVSTMPKVNEENLDCVCTDAIWFIYLFLAEVLCSQGE